VNQQQQARDERTEEEQQPNRSGEAAVFIALQAKQRRRPGGWIRVRRAAKALAMHTALLFAIVVFALLATTTRWLGHGKVPLAVIRASCPPPLAVKLVFTIALAADAVFCERAGLASLARPRHGLSPDPLARALTVRSARRVMTCTVDRR
jgi:hypothetical protein